MQPDPEKASCDEAAEREILDKLKVSMTEADLAELSRATQELRLKQETPDPPEALKSVPSLSLQGIPQKSIEIPIELNRIIQDVQFTDQKCFKQFVSQSKARMENRLRGGGHSIASARMGAKLNVAGWISEQMGGASYLEFLQSHEEKVDMNWDEIASSLEEIRKCLFSKEGCLINLTADGANLTKSEKYEGIIMH